MGEVDARDWAALQRRLVYFAHRRTRRRSWALAEEIAQEAITRFIERGGESEEPVFKVLAREVIGLSLNEWRRKRNTREMAIDDDIEAQLASAGSLEDAYGDRAYVARLHALLVARLDPQGAKVLEAMMNEVYDAADQVAATGMKIEEVRRARRRLFDHAERAAAELDRADSEATS